MLEGVMLQLLLVQRIFKLFDKVLLDFHLVGKGLEVIGLFLVTSCNCCWSFLRS